MRRNRKYRSAAIRFGPAIKAFLLCLLIGGAGVGYVWQKDQIARLGTTIKQREVHLAELQRLNEKQRRQLGTMRGPMYLDARIKEMNLGLVVPQPSQIWRLPEPLPEPLAEDPGVVHRQLASRNESRTEP